MSQASDTDQLPIVVLIHGLWFPAGLLRVLARRLRRTGFAVRLFAYPSVRGDLRTNADRLARFLATLEADTVHLVGHSLGGILIRALYRTHFWPRPGRIVTLGTPHGGSHVARRLARHGFWRFAMGRCIADLLRDDPRSWAAPPRELGAICGTRSFGLGHVLVRDLPRPNDGLLTVKESAYPAAREHLALPVSHTGMLFSRTVADAVASFLATGQFHRA